MSGAMAFDAGGETGSAGLDSLAAFVADARSEESIRRLVEEQSIKTAHVRRGGCREAAHYLAQSPAPRMIIVDLSGSEMPLSEMDEIVSVCGPDVVIIAMGEVNDIALYRDLTMLGVADYLVKPVTAEVLRRIVGIQSGGRVAQRQRIGKVICVTGARGGVGVTTFATNLAWMLSSDATRRTAIVDLDLHCGAVSLMLGLKSSQGFIEALRNPHRIDDLFIDRATVKKSDRLVVLATEESLEDDASYDPTALDEVLRTLQRRFHCIVIDLPRRPGNLYRQALEKSEIQIILASPTLTALRDSMRISKLIGREDLGQRAMIALNHTAPPVRGEISRADFEKTLGRRVDHEIAFSRAAVEADNQGDMIVQKDPLFGEAMGRVVNDIIGRASPHKPTARGLFGRKRS
jgi:pilus assembly protein CpaE